MKREDGEVHLKDFVSGGNLDAYLQKMLQQGEWADHIIVMCMAAYLQRDIIVITSSPNTNPDDNILWISSGNAAGDPLSLGHIWENNISLCVQLSLVLIQVPYLRNYIFFEI